MKNVVVSEEFDITENMAIDINRRGTVVSGAVVYGDFNVCLNSRVFKPLVRIFNRKIMHNKSVCFGN